MENLLRSLELQGEDTMFYLRQSLIYLTLALMLATLWALGYARQCEDELHRAQHVAANPEFRQYAKTTAKTRRAASSMPASTQPRN
ncbi:MAG: hypothetical protein JWN40_2085 [Phycisphaerales bacterium]|nr:hypothetical protein [Phycisphaerales bacterium]